MCGIVGVVGNISFKEEKAFKQMLIVDVLRGPHSTGMIRVENSGKPYYDKMATEPLDFIYNSDLFVKGDRIKGLNKALIGHNRFATMGIINDDNAHPFEFGDVIGVHNGTLSREYLSNLPDYTKFDVDSENIFYSIDKIGFKETYKKLHGAYVLVWYNKKEKKLNIIRNDKRPLYLSMNDNCFFFASESWMLTSILKRNGIKFSKPVQPVADKLCQFDLNGLDVDIDIIKKPFKSYIPPFYKPKNNNYISPKGSKREVFFTVSKNSSSKHTSFNYWIGKESSSGRKINIINGPYTAAALDTFFNKYGEGDVFKGIVSYESEHYIEVMYHTISHWFKKGSYIDDYKKRTSSTNKKIKDLTLAEFNVLVEEGCSWCAQVPEYGDRTDITFLNKQGDPDRTYICKDCSNNEEVRKYMIEFI